MAWSMEQGAWGLKFRVAGCWLPVVKFITCHIFKAKVKSKKFGARSKEQRAKIKEKKERRL